MESKWILVSFPTAIIYGEGHQATCTVWARKIYDPSGIDAAYEDLWISDDSVPLPDGKYIVSFNDQKHLVLRRKGGWKFPR
jgi:hypothetical protein